MKKLFISMFLVLCLLNTSCSSIKGLWGKNSTKIATQATKIETINNNQAINNIEKLDVVAGLAFGTDYALSKVNEPPREVIVARDMNTRIMSLTGSPTLEKMKEMQVTIDELTSTLTAERIRGQSKINTKDKEISVLQDNTKLLLEAKESEIKKYIILAQNTALQADLTQAQLDKLQSGWGLSAIWFGISTLFRKLMYTFLIAGTLFIILRIFAGSNPIAGAIFSVFSVIGGYFIRFINFIIPRAVEYSGNIATSAYNEYKLLVTKIVDSVEWIKQTEKATGKDMTLKELFVELDKTMDQADKDIITKIKKNLGY